MAVHLSVLNHYLFRRRERGLSQPWAEAIGPVAGFAVRPRVWLSISPLAMRLGALCTVPGVWYLAAHGSGFRRKLDS
jgi:hypothetical protein